MFDTVGLRHYEVDVVIPKPLDDATCRFLNSVLRSANRLVRFSGDSASIKLTVEVAGMCPEDALRAAAGEVARIFPNSNDEKYCEPRQMESRTAPNRRHEHRPFTENRTPDFYPGLMGEDSDQAAGT
jgi:hypothetical protein